MPEGKGTVLKMIVKKARAADQEQYVALSNVLRQLFINEFPLLQPIASTPAHRLISLFAFVFVFLPNFPKIAAPSNYLSPKSRE